MVGEPRDRTAYAAAFVSLGVALAIVLIGVCWLSTEGNGTFERIVHTCESHSSKSCKPSSFVHRSNSSRVPPGLWVTLALLGSVFVGALIPFPLPRWRSTVSTGTCGRGFRTVTLVLASFAFLLIGVVALRHASEHSLTCCAAAGLLLGLLVPSPARDE